MSQIKSLFTSRQIRGFATAANTAAAATKPPQVDKPLKTLKITNAKSLIGFRKDDKLLREQNIDIFIRGGKIVKIGSNISEKADKEIDAKDSLVTPAFVDPHTHIFPPQDRSHEFGMRAVKSYQEIAKEGGGIMHSVNSCRNATKDTIKAVNEANLYRFMDHGTLTVEMKSGYGLNQETEVKLLEAIKELRLKYRQQITIVPTFLGAHDFPPEFDRNDKAKRKEYVETVIMRQMIPYIKKKKLAEYCDVFCEEGYFDPKETRKILKKALARKLKIRLHADEFKHSQGAEIAAELKAHAADHLMAVSEQGIKDMAANNVVATILPGTTVFLGLNTFAPARKMIEGGVRVAIGTDYNPGSCAYLSQPFMMNLAIANCKMTTEEAFKGVTRNAALSLGRDNLGIIDIDADADLLIWKGIDKLDQIPYYSFDSKNFITHAVKAGKIVKRK